MSNRLFIASSIFFASVLAAGCSNSDNADCPSMADPIRVPRSSHTEPQESVTKSLATAVLAPEGDDRFNRIQIRFTNQHGTENIRILKPLDGSLYCWLMPHYQITVKGRQGIIKRGGRCRNFGYPWGNTTWPEDYIVDLGPGESHDETVYLPQMIPRTGEYQVSFKYSFTPEDGATTNGGDYPDHVWRGTAESQPVKMRFKKTK